MVVRQFGTRAKELAAKLGVDEAKVTDALKAFREANKPATPPALLSQGRNRTAPRWRRPWPLPWRNLSASMKPRSPLPWTELRTAEQAKHAAALKPRLDQAVKDGTLTQAEADAVTKAAEKGVIGGR